MPWTVAQVASGVGNNVLIDVIAGGDAQIIKLDVGGPGQSIPVTGSIPVTIQNSSITVGSLGPLIGTQSVSGSVNVGNLPSTQSVSGAVSQAGVWNVGITNTVPISGNISATVSFPATQAVSGSVSEVTIPSITSTAVMASTGVITLLNANSARKLMAIYNGSTGNMSIKWGSNASSILFNLLMIPGSYWESPHPTYTGQVTCIFATVVGSAMVSEG